LSIAPVDADVEALRRLVGDSVEQRVSVAERIGVNEQTLYQILRGIPLKSGRPRSVGRKLRDLLDAIYPGWREPGAAVAVAPARDTLAGLLDVVQGMPPARWASVRAQLDQLVQRPDMRAEIEAELRHLVDPPQAAPRKRLLSAL
jgi:hypothetical protein